MGRRARVLLHKQARLPSTPGRLGYFVANAIDEIMDLRNAGSGGRAAGGAERIQLNTTTA
jgi:hypothetical protein